MTLDLFNVFTVTVTPLKAFVEILGQEKMCILTRGSNMNTHNSVSYYHLNIIVFSNKFAMNSVIIEHDVRFCLS